jgi:hypothetical protein
MKKILSTSLLRYLIRILTLELGLVIVVGIILLLRDHTLSLFGNWMFWAGLITLMIGGASVFGNWGITRSGSYQISQTVSDQDISTRTTADLNDEQSSFSFLQLSVSVGILSIIISALV